MRLKGKIAVIPGGTSGIGKAIALGFINEGATVIVASRNEERVQEMRNIFAKIHHNGLSVAVDITCKDDVEHLMNHVIHNYGRIDILLNSAGFFPITDAVAIGCEEWKKVIDINLNGAFWCAQAAAPYMIQQNNGRIIFITSGQGLIGIPLMAHYSAAKGGVIALARALAAEFGMYNITVNTIAPGPTTTEHIMSDFPKEFLEKTQRTIPLRRLGKPNDCTGLAILLASEEGAYITGETITVDGGLVHGTAPL